jgi:hypothetical protein
MPTGGEFVSCMEVWKPLPTAWCTPSHVPVQDSRPVKG